MRKVRVTYVMTLICVLLLYFYSNHAFACALMLTTILLPLISAIVIRCIRNKVEIAWTKDGMANGKNLYAVLQIINRSIFPLRRVHACLVITNALTGETVYEPLELEVRDGKAASYDINITVQHCGSIQLALEQVRLYDLLLLSRCKRVVTQEKRLVVLPDIFPMEVTVEQSSAYENECEEYAREHGGYDRTEIYDLKAYQPGNSMHDIHWKLSSKLDELIVKEGSEPIERSVFLLWNVKKDGKEQKNRSKQEQEKQNALAEIFFSLALALVDQGIAPEIGWYNSRLGTMEHDTIVRAEDLIGLSSKLLVSHEECGNVWLKDEILKEQRHIVVVSQNVTQELSQLAPGKKITQFALIEQEKPAYTTQLEGITVVGCHYDKKEQELWELEI